jgi:hypothetical protein
MRDWERDMVEPCLLAREIEVALDIEAASFIFKLKRCKGEGRATRPCLWYPHFNRLD